MEEGQVFFHFYLANLGRGRTPVGPLQEMFEFVEWAFDFDQDGAIGLVTGKPTQAQALSSHLGVLAKENPLYLTMDAKAPAAFFHLS